MKHVYVDVINRFHMKSDIALLRYTCQLREGECKTKLRKPLILSNVKQNMTNVSSFEKQQ